MDLWFFQAEICSLIDLVLLHLTSGHFDVNPSFFVAVRVPTLRVLKGALLGGETYRGIGGFFP